ncbi:hypothetical protein IKF12_01335 [Candidatus Saccharibacteria bacterium]|nr:hypothetical protein [Candidatus Saccharibacteria bacterium]
MKEKNFSKAEVIEAILANNTSRVVEMLEEFDLPKDDTPPHFTSGQKELVSAMLSFASIKSWHDDLAEDLAHELIERTATTVHVFDLLRLVVTGAEIKITESDYTKIPNELRVALLKNDYKPKLAEIIEKLDEDVFKILIAYIVSGDEVETLSINFSLPIVRYLYAHEIIPNDLLLAFMAISLRDTSASDAAIEIIGGFNDFLESIFGGDDDDDDDQDERPSGSCHGGCGNCHGRHSDE